MNLIRYGLYFMTEALKTLQEHYPEWELIENKLCASYSFASFEQALLLINMTAVKAINLNHHPKYMHSYKTIDFELCTHSHGNAVTELDIQLANYIALTFRGL